MALTIATPYHAGRSHQQPTGRPHDLANLLQREPTATVIGAFRSVRNVPATVIGVFRSVRTVPKEVAGTDRKLRNVPKEVVGGLPGASSSPWGGKSTLRVGGLLTSCQLMAPGESAVAEVGIAER